MNRFLTISLGLFVFLVNALSPKAAEPGVMGLTSVRDSGLVKPLTDLSQELLDDTQHEYLFPLEVLAGVNPDSVALSPGTPIDVAHGQVHKNALRAAFVPSLELQGARPVLKLRVDFKLITQPGMYEVLLGITGSAMPVAGNAGPLLQQYLTLKLSHPEGQLRASAGTFVIEKNDAWFWSSVTLNPAHLQLTETGLRTRIEVKRFAAIQEPTQDERRVTAGIDFALPVQVPAGTTTSVPFMLRGGFPPGVSKGSFQLEGDQLRSPLLVSYEVHRRMYWGFVPLIFFLSGLFGWLVRIYLKHWRERAALQAQANELLLRIEEQQHSGLDATQNTALIDAAKLLEQKYNSVDTAELSTAISAADDALRKSIAERSKQRQELLVAINQDLDALRRRMTLPAELHKLSEAMNEALEATQREIIVDNLHVARTRRLEADQALRQLCEKMILWGERVQSSLAILDSWPQAPGLAVPPVLRDNAKASLKLVTCFDLNQTLTVEGALKPLLEALRAVGTLARQLKEQLRVVAESCSTELRLSERPDGTAPNAALLGAAAVDLSDLSQPFTALSTAWSQLKRAILSAIRVVHPQGVASAQQGIETSIAQGNLGEAIAQARSAEAPASPQRGSTVNSTTPLSSRVSASPSASAEIAAAVNGERPAALVVLDRAPAPLRVRHARSLAELRRATWVRSVCYVVLSTAAATLLYGPKFYGTWAEVFALIAFGFSSDFTVGTVLEETINKLKK